MLAQIDKTKSYFNESHQARLQKFKIRKELIYQAQAESAQTLIKPKGAYTVKECRICCGAGASTGKPHAQHSISARPLREPHYLANA